MRTVPSSAPGRRGAPGTASAPATSAGSTRVGTLIRLALAGLLVAAATLGAVVMGGPSASASTVDGVATIMNGSTLTVITSGGSSTQFTLNLPAQAACSGDSANDGYRVFSYLVQKGTDVSTITFPSNLPNVNEGQYGLLESNGSYYGDVNTAQTTGQIIGIPNDFEFGPLVSTDGLLSTLLYTGGASGVWEAGLACTNGSGVVTDYWNTEVTFTSSGSDPEGFVWSAVPGPSGSAFASITSAASTTFDEGVSNTFTPTATGTPTPTITESGTLPTGVTFSGGVLSGTPTQTGTFPITFTATNGIGDPGTQSFALTVQEAGQQPSFTSATSTTFVENRSDTFTVTASGTPTPTITESGTLPTGVTFSDGVLSGTPTQSGTFDLVFTADNTAGEATQDFTLTVGIPPAITSADSASFAENEPNTFTVVATGTPTPTLTESGTLPAGVTFAEGVLSGTPTATGTFPITFTASNGIGTADQQSFTLTVTPTSTPAFTSASSTSFVEGSADSFTVTASGAPTPAITESGTLPTGVTFADGVLSGTPTQTGTFDLVFTATNTVGTATQDFTLTVGVPPAFTSASSATFVKGQAGTFTVTATGTPTPTVTESGTLPTGVTFADGVLSGTPTQTGTFPITFTASNGIGTAAQQHFSLTVGAPPAITSADSTTFTEGTDGRFTVAATGTPTPTVTESGTLPAGVTFADGALSGTPTATGTFPITFTASNGIGTAAQQSFTLTVVVPPLAVTTGSLPPATAGTPYSTALAASGGTPPYTWSITAGALPTGLSLQTATGTISGTTTVIGTSPITVEVTDGTSGTAMKALTLTVNPLSTTGTLTSNGTGVAALPDGSGYWSVSSTGQVSAHGEAQSYGSLQGQHLNAPVVGIAPTVDGKGYWLVASDGGVFSFGDAAFHGSEGGQHLNAPVVGIAPTVDGKGYWLVASDGGVFSFGDAAFHGSEGGQHLNAPVVGIARTVGGSGYWLVASDGGVFSFGDAAFHGSEGGQHLNAPVVGIAPTVGGSGYWLVASDGGIFSFGDAAFHGSAGNLQLAAPVVGMTADNATGGYWLVASDGGIFSYDAPFFGAH